MSLSLDSPAVVVSVADYRILTNSRDEKRHQEKKNKSERAKKKKEDIARVRVLVDRALAADPRIKQFKADEKAARELKKRGGPPPMVVDPKVAAEEAAKKKIEDDKIAAELASKTADDKVRPPLLSPSPSPPPPSPFLSLTPLLTPRTVIVNERSPEENQSGRSEIRQKGQKDHLPPRHLLQLFLRSRNFPFALRRRRSIIRIGSHVRCAGARTSR